MISYYSYNEIIRDTKQNWLNLLGCKQFCLLILKGELRHQTLSKRWSK